MKKTIQIIQFTFLNILTTLALSGQPGPWLGQTTTSVSGALQGNVLINGVAADDGDYIAAFGPTGNLVGVKDIQNAGSGAGYFFMSIYGNDAMTTTLMNPGEYFTLQVWDMSTDQYYEVGAPSLIGEWQSVNGGGLIPDLTIDGAPLDNNWDFQVNADNLLPIELGHFGLQKRACNSYTIEWTTETELNNEFFSVQRSIDDIYSFENIAKIDGAGTSSNRINYTYQDDLDLKGYHRVYYRLKQTDYDGNWSHSNLIETEYDCAGSSKMSVYPNPFSTLIHIDAPITESSVITVYDTHGKLIFEQKGDQANQSIRTDDWPVGLYHINHFQNGTVVDSQKLIKQN